MINTVQQVNSWLLELSLPLMDKEVEEPYVVSNYLEIYPESLVCTVFNALLEVLNLRNTYDSCFSYPDLSILGLDCPYDPPTTGGSGGSDESQIFLGVGF